MGRTQKRNHLPLPESLPLSPLHHTLDSHGTVTGTITQPTSRTESFRGSECEIRVCVWQNPRARHVVVIAHGYGEHIDRYEHVAHALVAGGVCHFISRVTKL